MKRRCFVVSPIGEEGSDVRAHADDVFEYIIKPAMKKFDVEAVRSDHMSETGTITEQMFREIVNADICVALLTGFNPNVFYEVAVAQAAARPLVILLEKGHMLPFDVKDLRCIQYEMTPIKRLVSGVYAKRVAEQVAFIKEQGWVAPSLFEQFGFAPKLHDEQQLRRLVRQARPGLLEHGIDRCYQLPTDPERHIQVLTGDIADLETKTFATDVDVDVIVSLENTDLQLGRYCDADSISGTLRYLDASRLAGGRVREDSLNEQLLKQIEELGVILPMMPGRVVATPTTRLKQEYGIEYVFHVAGMQGSVGDGYRTMDEVLDDCVRHAMDLFDDLSAKNKLESILFPMLGAATSSLALVEVAAKILDPIVHKMAKIKNCKNVFILARLEAHRQALWEAATQLGLSEKKDAPEVAP